MNTDSLFRFVRPEHRVWDEGTFHEVVTHDCYHVREMQFSPADVVLDIGANIGFFSGLVLELGCQHVIAVEASPTNFVALHTNLKRYGTRVQCLNAAVSRSDTLRPELLRLHEFPADGNTGGVNVLSDGEIVVLTVSLDTLLVHAGPTVRLLKVDCEGSEYPVLMTSTQLRRVEEMCIEVHPVDKSMRTLSGLDSTVAGLAANLAARGYFTDTQPREGLPDGWAYIWAKRV